MPVEYGYRKGNGHGTIERQNKPNAFTHQSDLIVGLEGGDKRPFRNIFSVQQCYY